MKKETIYVALNDETAVEEFKSFAKRYGFSLLSTRSQPPTSTLKTILRELIEIPVIACTVAISNGRTFRFLKEDSIKRLPSRALSPYEGKWWLECHGIRPL